MLKWYTDAVVGGWVPAPPPARLFYSRPAAESRPTPSGVTPSACLHPHSRLRALIGCLQKGK
eukprot:3748802-Prymnesium_polylepis.1